MFVLEHTHPSEQCVVAAASWRGFASPLRHGRPFGSCATRGHRRSWTVQATDEISALSMLPPYVAKQTLAEEVREVPLP